MSHLLRFASLILVILMSWPVSAQDIINFKEFSIQGKLLEYRNDKALFLTLGGDTIRLAKGDFYLDFNELNSVLTMKSGRRPEYGRTIQPPVKKSKIRMEGRRLYGQVDFGMNITEGNISIVKYGMSGSINYKVLEMLNVGIGSGIDSYDDMNLIPIFLKVSGSANRQYVAPYFELGFGESIAVIKEDELPNSQIDPTAEGGLRWHSAFGFKVQDKISTIITFGMLHQKSSVTTGFLDWRGNPNMTTESRSMNMVTMRVGFIF